MPLLPAFEGELGTNKGTAIQAITHWNYSSICRGEDSLLVKLRRAGGLSNLPFCLKNLSHKRSECLTLVHLHSGLF